MWPVAYMKSEIDIILKLTPSRDVYICIYLGNAIRSGLSLWMRLLQATQEIKWDHSTIIISRFSAIYTILFKCQLNWLSCFIYLCAMRQAASNRRRDTTRAIISYSKYLPPSDILYHKKKEKYPHLDSYLNIIDVSFQNKKKFTIFYF